MGMNDLSSLPEFTKDNNPILLSMKINDHEYLSMDFSPQQDSISLNLISGSNQLISSLITNIIPLKWYNITLYLSGSGFRNKHQIKISVDSKLMVEESFRSKNAKDILQEIELYKNVYGISTSIMILGLDTNSLKDKNIFQKSTYEKGLYNLKTLNSFIKYQDTLNIINIFTPFGKENAVYGNPNIKLNFYYNNISTYLNLTKRIYMIRGLNPFIFILEELLLNQQHLLSNSFYFNFTVLF